MCNVSEGLCLYGRVQPEERQFFRSVSCFWSTFGTRFKKAPAYLHLPELGKTNFPIGLGRVNIFIPISKRFPVPGLWRD